MDTAALVFVCLNLVMNRRRLQCTGCTFVFYSVYKAIVTLVEPLNKWLNDSGTVSIKKT